jgi:uncharacterized membrane protein
VPVALVALPLFAICLMMFLDAAEHVARIRWLMAAGAWLLTLMVEVVALQGDIGRMNTVFKFYLQAWLLLGLVAGVCTVEVLTTSQTTSARAVRSVFAPVMAALVALAALYPLTAIPAKMADRMAPGAPGGLDGRAFMTSAVRSEGPAGAEASFALSHDLEAIRWLQRTVYGSPVILEGTTDWDLYRWGNRFAVHTGLPAVVGWNWHQQQQRASLPTSLVQARHDDVRAFYTLADTTEASRILRRYNVQYVAVGALEAIYYGERVWSRMDALVQAGVLRRVYQNDGARIYEVTWSTF